MPNAKTRRRTSKKGKNAKFMRYKPIPYQMPGKMVLKQKYTDIINLNPSTGGVPAVYTFSANGAYDCDITSTGHQPRGFDQMMKFYNHCTVIASKIVVEFAVDTATTLGQSTICGIELSDNSTSITASTGVSDAMESKHFRYITLSPSYSTTKKVSTVFGVRKFFKLGKGSIISEDAYRGSSSSNPAELAYYHVVAAPVGSTDVAIIKGIVKIVYTCVYHGLNDPGQS